MAETLDVLSVLSLSCAFSGNAAQSIAACANDACSLQLSTNLYESRERIEYNTVLLQRDPTTYAPSLPRRRKLDVAETNAETNAETYAESGQKESA